MKAKLYSHKKMELFLDAVPPRYEEKEGRRERRSAEGEAVGERRRRRSRRSRRRRVRLSEMNSGSIVLGRKSRKKR